MSDASIHAEAYLRERTAPSPADPLYLHLSDILRALQSESSGEKVRLLDYGCGGSPYRGLFPQAEYIRADLKGVSDLDLTIALDSELPVPEKSFDIVLSTQVLEHVPDAGRYLRECTRVLKPGGKLILTTHGLFPDHGSPYDFQRWTAEGLRLAAVNAGLTVRRMCKLTAGARALIFFNQQFHPDMSIGGIEPAAWILRLIRMIYRFTGAMLNRYCDTAYAGWRVVEPAESGPSLYIALMLVASREERE